MNIFHIMSLINFLTAVSLICLFETTKQLEYLPFIVIAICLYLFTLIFAEMKRLTK
jgi:hypothetical protein